MKRNAGDSIWISALQRPTGCCCLLQVKGQFDKVIAPFLGQHASAVPWPPGRSQRWQLYLWATAVVSAYAFKLGE